EAVPDDRRHAGVLGDLVRQRPGPQAERGRRDQRRLDRRQGAARPRAHTDRLRRLDRAHDPDLQADRGAHAGRRPGAARRSGVSRQDRATRDPLAQPADGELARAGHRAAGQVARAGVVDPQDPRLRAASAIVRARDGADGPRRTGVVPGAWSRARHRAIDRVAVLLPAGDHDLRWVQRDPAQHHRQAHPGARMNFSLTEDQRMLVEAAQGFTRKQSPVTRMRKLRDDPIGWSPDVWRQMGELGWLGLGFPEAVGGVGGKFVDLALLLEQLGAALVPEPIVPSLVAGMAILKAGDAAQQRAHLAPMTAGRSSLALAWAEGDGRYDPAQVTARAERTPAGFRLTGHKRFVLDGHAAA